MPQIRQSIPLSSTRLAARLRQAQGAAATGQAYEVTLRLGVPPLQILAAIGEQWDDGDEVCGVVVNVRPKQDRLQVWTKTASNEAAQVRATSYRFLGICLLSVFASLSVTAWEVAYGALPRAAVLTEIPSLERRWADSLGKSAWMECLCCLLR